MNFLLDPKIFNYLIMTMYGLNIGRWAWEGRWVDAAYWASALSITAVVTFGYSKQ